MREVVFDTETTGISIYDGHRVIEIAMLEVVDNLYTGKNLHLYINPEREIDHDAYLVHGISNEFIADKPKFRDVYKEVLDFISDSKLVAHNSSFDESFLNNELYMIDEEEIRHDRFIDSLKMARDIYPGQKNDLDSLCYRLGVDNSKRDKHSAIVDSLILVEVYNKLRPINNVADDIKVVDKYIDPRQSTLTRDQVNKHKSSFGEEWLWSEYWGASCQGVSDS